MISIVHDVDLYEVSFPYNDVLLEYIRAVPGRRWNPQKKFWTIPDDKLGFFLNSLKGTSFESEVNIVSDEAIQVNQTLQSTSRNRIPNIDISDIPQYVQSGGRMFEHQLDCMRFAIGRKHQGNFDGFILSDQQGLGKTLEVINMALFKKKYENAKHCLIICCINSAKYNWIEDINKHTNGEYEGYLLGSRIKRNGEVRLNGSGKEKFEDLKSGFKYGKEEYGELPYFLITNIEALRTEDRSTKKRSDKYIITKQIIELVNSCEISMIALDEVHRNASPSSSQGKQLIAIKNNTKHNAEWIPMTGTPIVNKPTDVFLPLYLVGGHYNKSYYKWNQHFCLYGGYGGYQVMGYKNIPELKNMLEPNMLRRTKDEVLDLPPKIRHVEYVENTKYQKDLYDQIRDEMLRNPDSITKALNPLSKFLRLRQVNGCPEVLDDSIDTRSSDYLKYNAKMKRLLELVEEITQENEKVVIFSNWVEPLRSIYRVLSRHGYRVNSYTGTMSQEDREHHKQQFIKDPRVQVLLGTVGALGTSHTLTVARNVIFFEETWNAATQDQAEDRCHRTGTTGTVNIYSIITKDTVDEKVHDIIHKKRGASDYIVDDNLDLRNHPELLNMLLDEKVGSKENG